MSRPALLVAYKELLKTARRTFQGDDFTLHRKPKQHQFILQIEFISRARSQFRNPPTLQKTVSDPIAEVNEVTKFLRHNFVQARLVGENHYSKTQLIYLL